ncbi:rod shape-determining protein MreC [Sphingomonas sp.]|uniref:rod shape-determining protein MreC n=1 Tax=Sphingomonas sp. TaxID=28214 RepID=UPI003B3BD1C9
MAPPRHRDRGFSRRIQYGLFFGYVAAAAGIVAGLALVLIARFQPLAFEGIRGLALDAMTPLATLTRPVVRGADSLGRDVGGYFGAVSENRRLRAELTDARRRLIDARVATAENVRLRRLAHIVGGGMRPVVGARIVGSSLTGNRRFATLTAGSADGVRAGQPVRAPEGLVGRIAETGAHAARIVLLTDGGSAVPLRVARTGAAVLGQGRGDGTIEVRATAAAGPGLRRGDLLVTSGVGGVFPPGIPAAVVASVSGEVASARPLADPARLDFAIVLRPVEAPPPPAPIESGGR